MQKEDKRSNTEQNGGLYLFFYLVLCYAIVFFLFVQFILPVPEGSSTEPLLIKAEPIRNAHGASVIKYLGKGKNHSTPEK